MRKPLTHKEFSRQHPLLAGDTWGLYLIWVDFFVCLASRTAYLGFNVSNTESNTSRFTDLLLFSIYEIYVNALGTLQ